MLRIKILAYLFFVLTSTIPASGHEFWIEPHSYQIAANTPIVADLRVGQDFRGFVQSYIPNSFTRFDLVSGQAKIPVDGRVGDRPALNSAVPFEGLWIAVHETRDLDLTYREWEKFVNFTSHKDYPNVPARHVERGLPMQMFKEDYRRFAKALFGVGASGGSDREVGLTTEIVAMQNPYTDDLSEGMEFRVLLRSVPRKNTQVEVFEKTPDGAVKVWTTRTDDAGYANVQVQPGHAYLIDSVTIEELPGVNLDIEAVWYSLWASLTFEVPES